MPTLSQAAAYNSGLAVMQASVMYPPYEPPVIAIFAESAYPWRDSQRVAVS